MKGKAPSTSSASYYLSVKSESCFSLKAVAAPEARHFYLHEKAITDCKIAYDLILTENYKNKFNCVLALSQFSRSLSCSPHFWRPG